MPLAKREEAEQNIRDNEKDWAIGGEEGEGGDENGVNPWVSPVVPVKQKKVLLVFASIIDYQQLVKKKDSYPLPQTMTH